MAKRKYYAMPDFLNPEKKQEVIEPKGPQVTYGGNYDWDYNKYKADNKSYVPKFIPKPMSAVNKQRRLLNAKPTTEPYSNVGLPPKEPFANMLPPRKQVVQQGKVPPKNLVRPNNPFAAPLVNFANTASLGLLEANNNSIQQLHKESPISSTIGSMAGYMMPFGVGSKLAKPITSKIAKPLLKRVTEGAIVGSGVELASGIVGQRGVEQTAKNVGYGAVLGGAADVGLYGLGKLGSKLIKPTKTPTFKSARTLKQGTLKPFESVKPTVKPMVKPFENANGKLKPRSNMTSVAMSRAKPMKFTKIKPPKKFKVNELLPDPKIVSSTKADKTSFKQKLSKLYTSTVDKNNQVSKFSKATGDETYIKATNSANQKNIADYNMTENMVNRKGEVIGK